MSEILTLHVGGFSSRVGYGFWQKIAAEHCVKEDGTFDPSPVQGTEGGIDAVTDRITTMFTERPDGRYTPRSIFMDLEPGTFDHVKSSRPMFDPSSFLSGTAGTDGNWAIGHYTNGAEMIDGILDVIRKTIEACEGFQGFQQFSCFGGGTGSGLGTLVASKLREEYPDRCYDTHLLFPSFDGGDTPVSIYNTTLSVHQYIENVDNCTLYQNAAIASHALCRKPSSYDGINSVISTTAAALTSSFRLPAQPAMDLRRINVQMVLYPRLHFYLPSISARKTADEALQAVREVLPDEDGAPPIATRLLGTDTSPNRTFAATVICRSNSLTLSSLERECDVFRGQKLANGRPFGFGSAAASVNTYPGAGGESTTLSLLNSTAMISPLKDLCARFTSMFRRKAHLHYYTGQGMDEMEFTEAECNASDLVLEYQQYVECDIDDGRNEDD